jgi:hypothetical protein
MKNYIESLHNTEVFSLPAGRYYVGDPCYVIHEDWSDFTDISYESGLAEWKGLELLIINTGGDGGWTHGEETYGVDAGMLAVVPVELLDQDPTGKGAIIELTDDNKVGYVEQGGYRLFEVFAGDLTITWQTFDNEELAEWAYENMDYSVITTREQYEALVTYITECDEDDLAEAQAALPQFA